MKIQESNSLLRYELFNNVQFTLGSTPRVSYLSSGNSALAIFIMSLHFFGVSSTLPARNRQQQAVS